MRPYDLPKKKLKEVIEDGKVYPEKHIGDHCIGISPPLRVIRGRDERGEWFLAYHPSIEDKVLPHLGNKEMQGPRSIVVTEYVNFKGSFSFMPHSKRVHKFEETNIYRKFVQGVCYAKRK